MTDQNEADRAAIAKARQQILATLEGDDVEEILAGLTSDHITFAPNETALDDIAKLRSWHQSRIDGFTAQLAVSSDELQVSGDWAFECWSGKFTVTPRDGGSPIEDVLKGIWIWQRQPDGEWKIARSIWNSDLPIPTV